MPATNTVVLGISALIMGASALNAQPFEDRHYPLAPGERRASATVSLSGFSRSRVQVWLHYSTNQSDLSSSNVPKGRASCRTLDTSRLRCEFIFPHLDHPTPNILTKTEIDGGEPPQTRPTLADYQQALLQFTFTGQLTHVLTDSNPARIGAPTRVYYRWVRVITGSGGSTTNDTIRSFNMARFFIAVNLGDSYASGEGAPNRDLVRTALSMDGFLDNGKANIFADEPMWQDTGCHQSEESGQERGVQNFIRQRPDVAIRFANFACSGAVTSNLTNSDQNIDPNTFMDPGNRRTPNGTVTRSPQLDRLASWLAQDNRTNVDLMLLSISGNDVGFGTVAKKCLIDNVASECRNDSSVTDLISQRLPLVSSRLQAIRDDLQTRPFSVNRIAQFGYPDPTRNSAGAFCSPDVSITQTCWGPIERSVSQADFRFIHDSFLAPLNTAISNFATATPNWVFVPTAALSRNFGLCNCSGFFNTLGQSEKIQGDLYGSVHPNRRGHREMYQPLTEEQLRSRVSVLFSQSASSQSGN